MIGWSGRVPYELAHGVRTDAVSARDLRWDVDEEMVDFGNAVAVLSIDARSSRGRWLMQLTER